MPGNPAALLGESFALYKVQPGTFERFLARAL